MPPDEALSIDLGSLLHVLVGFISRFNDPASYRIRVKFCSLVCSVCERTDALTLRRDDLSRNRILDTIMEWFQDPLLVSSPRMYMGSCLDRPRLRTWKPMPFSFSMTSICSSCGRLSSSLTGLSYNPSTPVYLMMVTTRVMPFHVCSSGTLTYFSERLIYVIQSSLYVLFLHFIIIPSLVLDFRFDLRCSFDVQGNALILQ